ncbi:glycosyltransferase WbuB [Pullulanibacillus pueri]|uniref:Glycosyltransferase WbuB n=2 Tax=Pullulanibacillus pueri TaxID=1437324 RepID=A0A8J2ZU33_9BACL|nr:glycosyltransferase WbuB [Pullulanibacillus pueri]
MISQNYYPEIGSAANRMKNIHRLLKKNQVNVTVLTTEPCYPNRQLYEEDSSFWSHEESESGQEVIRVHPKMRKYTSNMLNRLLHYLEIMLRLTMVIFHLRRSFDYVLVTSPPIFIGVVGLIAKWKYKTPLILDVRDLWPETLKGVGIMNHKPILKLAYLFEKKLYRSADRIIVNSPSFKSYILAKGIAEEKISFMPNSLTEDELLKAETPVKKEGPLTVIYTGNLGLAQDVEKLVKMAEHFADRKDIRFKIIGYGYKKAVIAKTIKACQLDNIELLHPKTREETLTAIHGADIAYVTLQDKEVFNTVLPGKIMDYMAMRKPIVGDVAGYSSFVIREAKCGLVAEDRDLEALCKAITRLVENPNLRKMYGDNGYRYAYRKLRWNTNIQVLLTILEAFNEEEGLHVCLESLYK